MASEYICPGADDSGNDEWKTNKNQMIVQGNRLLSTDGLRNIADRLRMQVMKTEHLALSWGSIRGRITRGQGGHGSHILFVFALHSISHLQMVQGMASEIKRVKMAYGPLASILGLVMGRGSVPVAIASINVECFQLLKLGQRIR